MNSFVAFLRALRAIIYSAFVFFRVWGVWTIQDIAVWRQLTDLERSAMGEVSANARHQLLPSVVFAHVIDIGTACLLAPNS